MQHSLKTNHLKKFFFVSIIICLPLLFFASAHLFSMGRNLVNATATAAATSIPSIDAQTIGNMTASLYSGDMSPGSIGVVVAISDWKEYYYIENVWFQRLEENPVSLNGTFVNTRINGSDYLAQIEFIPLTELQSEKLEGEIILQISRHLGSQFEEFKLHLHSEQPGATIFNEMQTDGRTGGED